MTQRLVDARTKATELQSDFAESESEGSEAEQEVVTRTSVRCDRVHAGGGGGCAGHRKNGFRRTAAAAAKASGGSDSDDDSESDVDMGKALQRAASAMKGTAPRVACPLGS